MRSDITHVPRGGGERSPEGPGPLPQTGTAPGMFQEGQSKKRGPCLARPSFSRLTRTSALAVGVPAPALLAVLAVAIGAALLPILLVLLLLLLAILLLLLSALIAVLLIWH